MPYSSFTSNIRKLRMPRRERTWLSLAPDGIEATPMSMSASIGISFTGASLQTFLTQDDVALGMYSGDTGREMKLRYEFSAYLEMSIDPEDNADRFTMIKRVSPTMPNPLPLDSQGKPT